MEGKHFEQKPEKFVEGIYDFKGERIPLVPEVVDGEEYLVWNHITLAPVIGVGQDAMPKNTEKFYFRFTGPEPTDWEYAHENKVTKDSGDWISAKIELVEPR